MTGNPYLIAADRLTFDYPGLRALDDVSFTLEAGTVTALIGPNGAGKTTLMRCLAGIDQPITGTIRVAGVDVLRQPRRARSLIGYLPDQFGLYDGLTVAQCLAYRARAMGLTAEDARPAMARAAARLDISHRLDSRAGQLSRGLRQRLAIAETILHNPQVLILDEPASGLDPEARDGLSLALRRLRDEGLTLLVSSHILSELEDYATDLLILRRGKLVDHRPIDQASRLIRSGRTAIIVILARPDPRLASLAQAHDPSITVEAVEERAARLLVPMEIAAHAALLAHLVGAGVPIAAFAPETTSGRLREAYMARLFAGETPSPESLLETGPR